MAIALKRTGLSNAPDADTAADETQFKNTAEGIQPPFEATFTVMALVGKALQFPEMRHSKIDGLRRDLANGRYRLEAKASAEAMLAQQCYLEHRQRAASPLLATLVSRRTSSPEAFIHGISEDTANSELVHQLAHDLNHKIGIIMTHTVLMNLDPQLDSINRMHLQVIRSQALRLLNIVGRRLNRRLTAIHGADEQ